MHCFFICYVLDCFFFRFSVTNNFQFLVEKQQNSIWFTLLDISNDILFEYKYFLASYKDGYKSSWVP